MSKFQIIVNSYLLWAMTTAMIVTLPPNWAYSQHLLGEREQDIFIAPTAPRAKPAQNTDAIWDLCTAQPPQQFSKECREFIAGAIAAKQDTAEQDAALLIAQTKDRVTFESQSAALSLRALKAQHTRSGYIFWLVILIVALGVVAAALQFKQAWHSPPETPTEITLGDRQLSIKTTWIGVVLLGMAMGFLTLYLTLVYPIAALPAG